MARWLVFEYDDFCPSGGMGDCISKTNVFNVVLDEIKRVVRHNFLFGHISVMDNRTEEFIDIDINCVYEVHGVEGMVDKIHSVSDMKREEITEWLMNIMRDEEMVEND